METFLEIDLNNKILFLKIAARAAVFYKIKCGAGDCFDFRLSKSPRPAVVANRSPSSSRFG